MVTLIFLPFLLLLLSIILVPAKLISPLGIIYKILSSLEPIVLFGFCLLSGIRLIKKKDWISVARARIAIWVFWLGVFLLSLKDALLLKEAFMPGNIVPGSIFGLIIGAGIAFLWNLYFSKSRRIKNTYNYDIIANKDDEGTLIRKYAQYISYTILVVLFVSYIGAKLEALPQHSETGNIEHKTQDFSFSPPPISNQRENDPIVTPSNMGYGYPNQSNGNGYVEVPMTAPPSSVAPTPTTPTEPMASKQSVNTFLDRVPPLFNDEKHASISMASRTKSDAEWMKVANGKIDSKSWSDLLQLSSDWTNEHPKSHKAWATLSLAYLKLGKQNAANIAFAKAQKLKGSE